MHASTGTCRRQATVAEVLARLWFQNQAHHARMMPRGRRLVALLRWKTTPSACTSSSSTSVRRASSSPTDAFPLLPVRRLVLTWTSEEQRDSSIRSSRRRSRPPSFDATTLPIPSFYQPLHDSLPIPLRRTFSTSSQAPPPSPSSEPPPSPPSSPFVERFPKSMQPYLRLARVDKPIGTYLLLWPGYWGLALAAAPGTLPDWRLLAAFGVGTVVMRSAGCTVNDLWDRDIDKNVERTKHRPITSGEISVRNGVVFLGAQLLVGLGVLVQLNEYSIYLGMASVPLVLAYPLMKRWTDYPQLFLGVTFNWGVLMGWAATHGACDWPVVLPLYASAVAWTMVYDTLYAHQDKKDDARLGLHSTALTFGEERTKPILAGFSAAMIGGLLLAGVQADLAWPFYVGTGLTAGSLMWQLGTAELDNPTNLAARFEANKWVGGVVFGSIVAGRYFC